MGRNRNGLGCGSIPGESVFSRQGFRVRKCFTLLGSELAAVVTRSHPATPGRRTDDEQISQTGRQTEKSVLMPIGAKRLKGLVGAPGLEPGTR
jgi:hypothetical protein